MPILAGGDGWGVVVATICRGHTQLMVSGEDNLAATIAPSVDRLRLLLSLVALPKCSVCDTDRCILAFVQGASAQCFLG